MVAPAENSENHLLHGLSKNFELLRKKNPIYSFATLGEDLVSEPPNEVEEL